MQILTMAINTNLWRPRYRYRWWNNELQEEMGFILTRFNIELVSIHDVVLYCVCVCVCVCVSVNVFKKVYC